MANRNFNARIRLKRDTSANWESANPVLLNGEKIIVDTAAGEVREKIGDGTKTYSQLPFTDEKIRGMITGKADKIELERIKYYGDKDIEPSDASYFTVNDTGETITGLTDAGQTKTELIIPYKINGILISNIGIGAFAAHSSLITINIPNSVESIGEHAFYECTSLISVNIPNSVRSIGESVFGNCSSLTLVNLSNNVTSIGSGTFSLCSLLASINIPNGITSIGSSAFYGCSSLNSINIPNSVTDISSGAFSGCTNLTIYCEQGSSADTYAKSNNIPVVYTGIRFFVTGKSVLVTVPINGWNSLSDTNGTSYYTIDITNSDLTSSGYPICDVSLPSDVAAARLQSEAYQCIDKITVNDGSLTIYCFDNLPSVSFQIRIQLIYF